MSYYTKRGKIHFVSTLEDEKAACGLPCSAMNNITTNKEDVTCARCKLNMSGKKMIEDSEDWGGFSMSCPGRRTHRW